MALTQTPAAEKGANCPEFSLPGVDGKSHSRQNLVGKPAAVIMFICNHCPYVKAIEDRLIQLGKDLREINVPLVGISSNDANHYPEDSFANMAKRASEKNYTFSYLYDEDQTVAKTFGAVCTPDFFVYDHELRLAYRGRLDDSWKDASAVQHRELFEVVRHLVGESSSEEGKNLLQQPKFSQGCSIKWKEAHK